MTAIKIKMNLERYLFQEIYNSQKILCIFGANNFGSIVLNFN